MFKWRPIGLAGLIGENRENEYILTAEAYNGNQGVSAYFILIPCKSVQKKQAFEMKPPKERHLADRE